MKATVFCILCLVIGVVVNTNANKQMKQDLHKMQQQSYTM
jgi:preprotein translocase subunit SecG